MAKLICALNSKMMTAEVKEDELLPYTDQTRDAFVKVFNLTVWIL